MIPREASEGAVPILTRVSLFRNKHDIYDETDEWDEANEVPPSAMTGIEESSDTYSDTRYYNGNKEDAA